MGQGSQGLSVLEAEEPSHSVHQQHEEAKATFSALVDRRIRHYSKKTQEIEKLEDRHVAVSILFPQKEI